MASLIDPALGDWDQVGIPRNMSVHFKLAIDSTWTMLVAVDGGRSTYFYEVVIKVWAVCCRWGWGVLQCIIVWWGLIGFVIYFLVQNSGVVFAKEEVCIGIHCIAYSIVLQREVQLVEEASMKRQYCEEVATALHGESRPLQPKILRFQNLWRRWWA